MQNPAPQNSPPRNAPADCSPVESPPAESSAPRSPPLPDALPAVEHLVLYDGVCGLCDRFVQLLLRIDRRAALHFAPLQGSTAAALEAAGVIPSGEDTMVYIAGLPEGTPRALIRSDAALGIVQVVGRPWSFFAVFRLAPRPLRDLAYRAVARSRYRIFGRFDVCKIPTAETRTRFLD